jgi:hypothetical protein
MSIDSQITGEEKTSPGSSYTHFRCPLWESKTQGFLSVNAVASNTSLLWAWWRKSKQHCIYPWSHFKFPLEVTIHITIVDKRIMGTEKYFMLWCWWHGDAKIGPLVENCQTCPKWVKQSKFPSTQPTQTYCWQHHGEEKSGFPQECF